MARNWTQRMTETASLSLVLVLAASLGVALGLGLYTFRYAKGFSYFKTDPAACANCHIMQRQYDGWQTASHHTVARCIDCHLPESFIPKYLTKAENGWRHGKMFTLDRFVEPIQLTPSARQVLLDNCKKCHAALTQEMAPSRAMHGGADCLHCHAAVGHGQRAALGGPLRSDEIERVLSSQPASSTAKK
ncbi:MAG: cytochrome c nitrite reductase small subunit [Polyangia bacterium]|jgi:cytochrome c nitrite reductase small subunit